MSLSCKDELNRALLVIYDSRQTLQVREEEVCTLVSCETTSKTDSQHLRLDTVCHLYHLAWTVETYLCRIEQILSDGDRVKVGDVAFYVEGNLQSLLRAERILLNIMQRMSGVATQTAVYADRIADLHTKVLDTRKTTPGLRVLEKMAVKMGGGENHRIGLFDMILLKDNHIDFAGGVAKAVTGAKEYLKAKGKTIPIECEVRSLEDIKEVFAAGGVDRIMFDNFSVEQTREAVALVAGRCETESSGGITLETLRDYAETGVDFISVGALTHQIKSLDMSLKAC